jgi:hypothetical protein
MLLWKHLSAQGAPVPLRRGWNLTRERWDTFTAIVSTYATTPWRRVRLEEVRRDSVPARPGIYAISAPVARSHANFPPNLDNVVYVGKASALKSRFMTHCKQPAPQLQRAKHCFAHQLDFWFIESSADVIAELESALIECLGPSANLIGGAITARIVSKPVAL